MNLQDANEVLDLDTGKKRDALKELASGVFGSKSSEKLVDRALEKKDSTTNFFTQQKELGKSVEKKHSRNILKWATGGALGLLGISAGKELFSGKEKEIISTTTAEVLTDDKKLKVMNDAVVETKQSLEKSHASMEKIGGFFGISGAGANLKTKATKYRAEDYSTKELFGDAWEQTSYQDESKTKKRSWLGRIFTFLPVLFMEYQLYRKVKKMQKSGLLNRVDDLEKSAKKLDETGKKVADKANKGAKGAKRTAEQLRGNTAIKKLRQKSAKNLIREYKKSIAEASEHARYKKISASEYAKRMEDASVELFEKSKKKGVNKEILTMVRGNKIPGISLSEKLSKLNRIPVGAIGVANAINISIFAAVQQGKFSSFFSTLTNKETLKEAFIPGVGIYNSINRAKNGNDPTWVKTLDVGLNTVGDTIMAAGIIGGIFSAGTTTAAAYAARGSILAVGRSWLSRQSLKIAAKKAARSTKNAAKLSALSAPFSILIALAAKKFNGKRVEQAFRDNVLSEEQTRSLELAEAV